MSVMKTINVDADPKNANWPKRTKDVTDYPLVAPTPAKRTVKTPSLSAAVAAKKSTSKRKK